MLRPAAALGFTLMLQLRPQRTDTPRHLGFTLIGKLPRHTPWGYPYMGYPVGYAIYLGGGIPYPLFFVDT